MPIKTGFKTGFKSATKCSRKYLESAQQHFTVTLTRIPFTEPLTRFLPDDKHGARGLRGICLTGFQDFQDWSFILSIL